MMTKEKLASYLLTLQLVEAGYQITWDELLEMYGASSYLKKRNVLSDLTITNKQNKSWFVKAVKEAQKHLKLHKKYAEFVIAMLDLDAGLIIKDDRKEDKKTIGN